MTVTPVGLDLSLVSSGWAIWGGQVGRVRTDLAAARPLCRNPIARRHHIAAQLYEHVRRTTSVCYRLVVLEKRYTDAKNRKTGLDLAALHAVVLDELDGLGGYTAFAYVAPATLKRHLAGRGGAGKDEMVAAAQAVGYTGSQDDEADAWGLALLGHHLLGGTEHLTPHRLSCLAAVEWLVPLPPDTVAVTVRGVQS